MTATPSPNTLFAPISAIANTPLPDGYDESALYLRRFILNAQQSVLANEVAKHRMLKDALHAHVQVAFGEQLESLVSMAATDLYEKLMANNCAVPDDELEQEEPLPSDFPKPDPE